MGTTSRAIGSHGSFETRLPPQPASVAESRRLVRELLRSAGREDLVEPTVLLVSEIVTNALLHAGTEIGLSGRVDDVGVRMEVSDGSPHLPSRRRYAPTAGTGRGLLMIEAMVDDWGATRHQHGKTVWFELSSDTVGRELLDDDAVRRTDGKPGGGRTADNVSVVLQNVPLLLHAAWQEHSEALLREFLLASLDSEGPDPIQMHAEATDAIAVLEEHVPRVRVDMLSDELMGDAVEPHVSAPHLEVPVPLGSVSHFETLDRTIEAALDLSAHGLVLTPPSQPEVQAFRRWLCRQVLRQAAGSQPEPWSVPGETVPEHSPVAGWDPSGVTEATVGRIAADQASRILAVSPEAARILGYDDPAELVGQRIVAIVPERLRQAHVAGFTMYLLVGRKPLIDQVVAVPALRRDGTEVLVDLEVREHPLGDGRVLLMAGLRPVED